MLRCDERSISKYVSSCVERVGLGTCTRVLDVPCGFGRHAHWFAERGCQVVAADIDASRVALARRNAPSTKQPITWLVADIEEKLPIFNATFDLVVIVHYFSHEIINRAAQALKPGGHLIFETFAGHGQNWIALPKKGWGENAIKGQFQMIHLNERPVGPTKSNVVVRILAERVA